MYLIEGNENDAFDMHTPPQGPCARCQGKGTVRPIYQNGAGATTCRACNGYGTADPATWDNY